MTGGTGAVAARALLLQGLFRGAVFKIGLNDVFEVAAVVDHIVPRSEGGQQFSEQALQPDDPGLQPGTLPPQQQEWGGNDQGRLRCPWQPGRGGLRSGGSPGRSPVKKADKQGGHQC